MEEIFKKELMIFCLILMEIMEVIINIKKRIIFKIKVMKKVDKIKKKYVNNVESKGGIPEVPNAHLLLEKENKNNDFISL